MSHRTPAIKMISPLFVNVLFLILNLIFARAYAEFLMVDGNDCPNKFHLTTREEAQLSHSEACTVLASGEVSRLAGGASIVGADANCAITESDPRTLNRSLCMSDEITCDDGKQLIRGQNIPDYCARVSLPEDLSSWDITGSLKCHDKGKDGFSHFQYLYAPPNSNCSDTVLLEEENFFGRVVDSKVVTGTKTIFCDEKVQPVYDEDSKIVACPFGAELVKGQTVADHCAFYWEEAGLDSNGDQVCQDLGGFKEYQYRFFKDDYEPRLPEVRQYCHPGGYMKTVMEGHKTAICQQEQLPLYDEFDILISCPAYTLRVNGHSSGVPDHCAFPDGHFWYGLSPVLDDKGQLEEEDICWDSGRGNGVKRVKNEDGSHTLLCTKEDFAHPKATALVIEADPTGLQCDAGDQEYIAAGKSYLGVEFRSHCAWLPSSADFIEEGLDTDGLDVCDEYSDDNTTYNFAGYIYPGGVKTPDCKCEGSCPGTQDSGRFKGTN